MFSELLKTMKQIYLEKGEKLYDLGDSADYYYFTLEGGLLLCQPDENEEEQ